MKIETKRLIVAALSSVMVFTSFTNFTFADENAVEANESIDLAAVKMTVNAGGWKESVYAEWLPVDGAAKYEAYVKKSSEDDSAYKQLDDELIRQYPTYWRADAVGLKAGEYDLKIVAKDSAGAEIAWSKQKGIYVKAYNRTGFAFSPKSTYKTASGAYNDDGTLKDNAIVLYVTKDTAKTVAADIVTNSKGGTTAYTGLQAIIGGLEKGYETRPIDIRIIGTINAADMDSFGSSAEGLQIKGKSYTNLNLTIEGIGNDATIRGFGFLIRSAANIEFRNFAIMNCKDDSVSIDTDNCNLWIHNLDIFYGQKGSASDQVKGDGTIDIKGASTYATFDENHIWDCGKTSLCGMKSDCYTNYYVTYSNNWFDHSDSRHPRIRGGNIHVYNNYFDGNSKYGTGMTTGGSAFVENNYFRNVKYPMLVSMQGSDIIGGGTFSGEDGGYIKEYGNVMTGKYSFITGEDAYSASSRDEKVPNTYIAKTVKSGVRYSNFDTDTSVMYSYAPIAGNNVPTYVTSNAGRLNHGDFTFEFDNTTEDKNSNVIQGLRNAIEGYESKLVSVGGAVTATSAGGEPSSLTGIDGNVVSYQPITKLEGLNLPNKTDQSQITAGNPANLTSSTTEALKYDLKIETSDFKSTSTYNTATDITGSPGTFTVVATASGTVSTSDTKGIQLGGAGNKTSRAIKFTTTDKGILYLTGASTSTDERFLEVMDESGTVLSGTAGISTAGSKTPVTLPSAGTYYVYSKGKGINVSFLGVVYGDPVVPDEPVYDDTPGFSYTSVEPAAPIEASKPFAPKSTEGPEGEWINPNPDSEPTTAPTIPTTESPSEATTANTEEPSQATTAKSETPAETTTTSTGGEIIRYGDVNGNKIFEVNDASLILDYILNKTELLDRFSDFAVDLADVDGDGNINAEDASLVLEKYSKGSDFKFPNGRDWNDGETAKQPEQTTSKGETPAENTTAGGSPGVDTPVTGDSAVYNFSDAAFDGISTTSTDSTVVNGLTIYTVAGVGNADFTVDGMHLTRYFKLNATDPLKNKPSKSALGLTLKAGDKVTVYTRINSNGETVNLAFVDGSSFAALDTKTVESSTPEPVEFTAAVDGTYYIQNLKSGRNARIFAVTVQSNN